MLQWFQRWKPKKPAHVAQTLVAKELAQSVYVVLTESVEFTHQFKGTPLTKRKEKLQRRLQLVLASALRHTSATEHR